MAGDIVEAIRTRAGKWAHNSDAAWVNTPLRDLRDIIDHCDAQDAEITALRSQLAEAMAALKPFAEAADILSDDEGIDIVTLFPISDRFAHVTTVTNWREARRVIDANEKEVR